MDSRHLTPEQFGIISKEVAKSSRYLSALQQRMGEKDFPTGDRLVELVRRANHATDQLYFFLSLKSKAKSTDAKSKHDKIF